MSVQKNSLDALVPFYGGDGRGKLFTVFNYRGTEFRQPLNSADHPETIEGSVLHNLMLNKNYADSAKSDSMKRDEYANDVNNEFVDFVVRTGAFHRSVDRSTSVGVSMENVRKAFEQAAETSLETPVSRLVVKRRTSYNPISTTYAIHTGQPDLATAFGVSNSSSYFDYLNAALLASVPALRPTDMNNASSLSAATPSTAFTDGSTNFGDEIESYVGDCNLAASTPGALCMMSFWDINNKGSNAGAAVQKLLGASGKDAAVKDALANKMNSILIDYAVALYNNVDLGDRSLAAAKRAFDVLADKSNSTRRELRANLVAALRDQTLDAVKQAIGVNTSDDFVTLRDPAAFGLYSAVFAKYADLDPDVRAFYNQLLQLFRRDTVGASWEVVVDPHLARVADSDRDLFRLNLVKAYPGAAESRFEASLPFVPVSAVGGLWYTDASGMKKRVEKDNFGPSVLKELYRAAYTGASSVNVKGSAGVATINVADLARLPALARFSLSDSAFVRNVVLSKKQEQTQVEARATGKKPSDGSFDDLFQDMSSGLKYQRDETGRLFRLENGAKVFYDENGDGTAKALATADSCYSTGVKGDCDEVFRCLLSGDPSSLSRCLSTLRNKDMFQVAQDEFAKMDPNVAKRIMKTFNIRTHTQVDSELGRKIVVPEDFEHWVNDVLTKSQPAETRDAILNNTPLVAYLRGLLTMIRANPAILNKDISAGTKSSIQEPVPEYLQQLGIQWFVSPVAANSNDAMSLGAELLKNGIVLSPLEMKTPVPVPLALAMANVTVNRGNLMPVMAGGDPSTYRKRARDGMISNSEMLLSLFHNAYEEMQRNDKELVEEDRNRIQDAIAKVNKLEGQLLKLLDYMQVYNDLQAALRANGTFTQDAEQLSLADLKSRSTTAAYLVEASNELKNCIDNNIRNQGTLSGDLVGKLYKALTDAAAGKQNSVISPVA